MARTALFDISSPENIDAVWKVFWKNSRNSTYGCDRVTPDIYNRNHSRNITALSQELRKGYKFSPLRAVPIEKKNSDKKRLICIPTVEDRIVQRLLLGCLEGRSRQLGILNEVSFGFVKDTGGIRRGAHAARKAAIERRRERPWGYKADISAFFDNIQREQLLSEIKKAFRLSTLHKLVEGVVRCEIDYEDPAVRRISEENGIKVGRGLRQGMPLSPLLSNFALRDFDRSFRKQGYDLVRYADDLVVFSKTEAECLEVERFTKEQLNKLDLNVSEKKSGVAGPDDPVEFLGMEIQRTLKGSGDGYALIVPPDQLRKISEKFVQYHDWSFSHKQGIDIGRMLRRLDQIASGYCAAYYCADNYADLSRLVNRSVKTCVEKVYSSLLGVDVMRKLSPNQRKFLMLP